MSMPSFLKLSKYAAQRASCSDYKLAVLGDCSTQHLARAISGYSIYAGNQIDVLDTDYNQITAQLMDEKSEVYGFKPDTVLLFMSTQMLFEKWCQSCEDDRKEFADRTFETICRYWSQIDRALNAKAIQFLFVEEDDRTFGNYGLDVSVSFYYQLKKLNYLMISERQKKVFLIDLNTIRARFGAEKFCDRKMYYMAKLTVSLDALPETAKSVVDTIDAIRGKVKKCIILDLDNTLWGGVIGDDGLEGIQIGELGSGHAFTDFQMWLRELRRRGILLVICSRNDEDTAKKAFTDHPEMILRLDDISLFIANWNDKASNILYIQQQLNIGMDSIVYIDDNPFERNLIREIISDITVPEMPEDPSCYVDFLKNLNLFETASYSDEDKTRTRQYQSEEKRHTLEARCVDYDDYLISLNMEAEAEPFDPFHFSRIAQLTQRSNQFNLRTVRYTEDEIQRIAENDSHITIYFTLKDRFGDYGLVSAVILDRQDQDTLFISEWLMSCRILKRGMEEFILNTIVETAKAQGCSKVIGEYIPTAKNKIAADIYIRSGFEPIGEKMYCADVNQFLNLKTHIKRRNRQ